MDQVTPPAAGALPTAVDESPSLAAEMRSSALLFGLTGAIVAGALLLTRALGA